MALFSMRVQVIQRSAGKSVVAAAAYRAGERLHDARQGMNHDYARKGGVVHKELLVPGDAPAWAKGLDRETLWNMVDARERRKDSQTARELRIMIPRELDPQERIHVVRDFVERSFVAKGMIADVCWHDKIASDGQSQPHAHVMLTMRPLATDGFGDKVRHDMVPDPTGRKHPDGRAVLVESNPDSWNSAAYYETCRLDWETTANAALERAGSDQRIDRRSYLERGIARLPEPALRLAYHLNELRGVMQERFGQWQYAQFYRGVEDRAKDALERFQQTPFAAEAAQRMERFFGWFERQAERLAPARDAPAHEPPAPSPELER